MGQGLVAQLSRVPMAAADSVERLIVACFDPGLGEGWPPDQVAPTLAMPGTWAGRADLAGAASGGAPATPEPAGFFIARQSVDEAELLLIGVAPGHRQAGLGGLLLDRMLADAHASGARKVFLEVRESNVAAIALYSSRGFEIVGRRPGYYRLTDGTRQDALTMRHSS